MDYPLRQASDEAGHGHWADKFLRLSNTLPLQILFVALAYFVTGRLSLELAIPPGYATAVWPPSGISLAAVLLSGTRVWPGIALGSFLINVATGFDASTGAALATSLAVPAAIGCGAALQAVVGGFLVRRFVGFPSGLVEVRQVVRLLGLGGLLACLINATTGITMLLLVGRVAASNAPFNWATWWAGDTIGVFVFTPLAIAWFSPPREQWQNRRLAISGALAVTFAIVVVLVSYTAALERSNLSSDFNDRVSVLPVELDKATALHLGTVGAVQALLTSSSTVDRRQFGLFASGVRSRVPGIQALEWAPRISLAERPAFETATRNDGAADFEISELSDGRLIRAGQRSEYFPITYVEPLAGNEPALGFDLGSQASRLAGMQAARDSGKTSVSERITLVQGGENKDGFLAFAPVYRTVEPGESIEQRHDRLLGFALGVFRFADVVNLALRGYDLSTTQIWLIDETDPVRPVLLYTNSPGPPSGLRLQERGLFGVTTTLGAHAVLDVGGRHWALQMAPTQTFLARYRLRDSWTVLLVGLVFTSLVGAFVIVITGRESMFRLLFDGNPQPMWAWDRETLRFVEVNQAAILKYGYSRAEFATMRLTDIRPPEDVPQLIEHVTSLRGSHRGPTGWRHRLRDGTIINVEIEAHDIELSGRKVVLNVAHDVTEKKRIEQALIESERSARSIVETALDAFIQMDESGRILEWNRQAEAVFGWSRPEAVGSVLGELIVPQRHRADHEEGIAHYLRTGESHFLGRRIEIEALRKDGREIKVELAVTALERKSGHVFNAFVNDITERRASEERLRQTQRMEAVGQLTGGVAHDFNNILTVITCTIDILHDAVSDRPQLATIARTIGEAAEHGAQLTQSLLAFARKQPLQPLATDINALVVEAAKLLRPSLGEHIEIEPIFEDDAWPALVDPSQLTTALLNLAVNARDAMPNGGTLILETRNVELDDAYASANPDVRPGPFVMIAVSDNGSGIAPEIRDRVFEPFFTTKETDKGTGLGLSMVYGFVKQSGGHVKVYSEQNRGTSIKIYLPRAVAPAERFARTASAARTEGGNETILLVEDDALVRNSVKAQLESLGYAVILAANAAEALALERRGTRFDLLFTDVIMPGGMNGRQLAEELIRLRPSTDVLFTSGYTENAIMQHGRLDRGVLLLAKPYRKSDLARMVRMALDR